MRTPVSFVLVVLATGVLAGCSAPTAPTQGTYAAHLDAATAAAEAWQPTAALVGAFAVERRADVEPPAWLLEEPPLLRDAVDPVVGDGQAPVWVYLYQSGTDLGVFLVDAAVHVEGPILQSTLNEEGDDDSTAPIDGAVLDPSDVQRRLREAGHWFDESGLLSWELLRHDASRPTTWIVRDQAREPVHALTVDAATASLLCDGGEPVHSTFLYVNSGQVNAVTPAAGAFELPPGHAGLEVQLSGSDEALNELEMTVTSPSGQATVLTWTGGAAPMTTYLVDPEAGSWAYQVRQTGGAVASYVARFEPPGLALSC